MVDSSEADDSFKFSSLNVSAFRFDMLAAMLFTVEFFNADFSRIWFLGVFLAVLGVDFLNGVLRSITCIDFLTPLGVLTSAAVFGDSPSARIGDAGACGDAPLLLSNRDGVLRDRSELRGIIDGGVNVVFKTPETFNAFADVFDDSFSLLK